VIPLGAQVRWAGKYQKNSPVIGVVTGHPQPRMVEVDGKGAISEGLLEVVGEMTDERIVGHESVVRATVDDNIALRAERDALRELVVAQGVTIAELAIKDDPAARIDELQEWAANASSYVEDLLLLFMGERRPVRRIEPDELRRLADFIFEGA